MEDSSMSYLKQISLRNTALVTMVLVLSICVLAPATEAVAQGEPFVELLRQDIQTDKVLLMTAALNLTEEQGEKFWPLYREYQTKLSTLGDGRIKLIKDFAANYDTMTEDKAKDLAKTSFDLQEKQLSLLKKTHKNVSKEIGPILAARFAQVENQLLNLIDLQIAAEMPLIK